MLQSVLTILVQPDPAPGRLEELKSLLAKAGPASLRFAEMSNLHFSSLVLLERDPEGDPGFTPLLAFASYFDGLAQDHLDRLLELAGKPLEAIYAHARDFPKEGFKDRAGLKRFLLGHSVPYTVFYSCYPGYGLPALRESVRLKNFLGERLDGSLGSPGDLPALAKEIDLSPLKIPPSTAFSHWLKAAVRYRWVLLALLAGAGTALWFMAPAARPWMAGLLFLSLAYLAVLLAHEALEPCPPPSPVQVGRYPSIAEKVHGQNQMVLLLKVKPGFFRRMTLRGVLALFEFAARHFYDEGDFGGISSIHFAHFVLLEKGRRLLFFTQYDGSWENYLGDFIDKNSPGLTCIGTNTLGFPRTWGLFFAGSRDETGFKDWIRGHQAAASVFYSAHDGESTSNILDSIEIRKAADRGFQGREDEGWLSRL